MARKVSVAFSIISDSRRGKGRIIFSEEYSDIRVSTRIEVNTELIKTDIVGNNG